MGDDCCNVDSMGRIKSLIQHRLPNTFVHSIRIGNTINDDHQAGFFGKIEEQVDTICKELSKIKELKNGFNAIGFSQQCNRPKVHRLITFGSPHAGVSDIPNCTNPKDFTCKWMRSLVHKGVYTDYIQNRVIQAQYFRDPNDQQSNF
ncbi:Alpha/Beta hydrolase protein [Cokeromyces recurvatus]|uniref:Alpha/Beta hydrolase protein n=1 Tax=Cokeromyces recurvatus TaxID=90255 RepID=UPI0022202CAB|nr:Alpha/Beta hydrolase protein [Cokeromyces recurvatus]KAI7904940.1 Alpha/Beta hydrolase protein [Cokeromyces recurvatus]